jgi:outer membrane receptor for Fe3+-dicitrate
MESAPHETYPLLLKALEGDIAGERAFKASYTFAYDEQRFLMEEDYESADIVSSKFWDRNQAWSKNHVAGYPPTFVKDKSPEKFWSNVPLFMFTCYLRQTPREYWWESKCMSIRASASFRQRWRPT